MSHAFAFPTRRVLVALLTFCAFAAHAATLRVPSQYPTIQGAIDASHSGDTVLVAPGIYSGDLRIHDKGILSLESEAARRTERQGRRAASWLLCEFAVAATSSLSRRAA